MAINKSIRGIRQSLAAGYVIGRVGSRGAPVPVKIADLMNRASNSASFVQSHQIDNSITFAVVASEAIAAGAFVNLFTNSGVLNMRNANATGATKPAHGFVKEAVASSATGNFFGPSTGNDALSGLTPGATYYLDTTNGLANSTAPSASGNIVQELGVALSATEIAFAPKLVAPANTTFAATQRVLGRNSSGAGFGQEVTASQVLDWLGSTQGDVLFRSSSGWTVLAPGTAGNVLTTQGAGADPTWAPASGGGGGPSPANPTATASDVAVNGSASTYMRSDAAPAVQKTSAAQFGLAKVDGSTITASSGVISAVQPTSANPSATASDTAVNGSAATFMRSDAAPAVQKGSASVFGIVKVDGSTITASGGVISAVGGGGGPSPANPTATASDTAVNGVASTYMRSDAAPAVQLTSSSQFGLCKPDGSTVTSSGGVLSAPGSGAPARTDVYTATGANTWTKPVGATRVEVMLWGSGGGGGGGATAASGARSGGGGGGGGARAWQTFNAADLGATETVTIGAGGAGGAATLIGNPGNNTTFGAHLTAFGGGQGSQGTTLNVSGGGGAGMGAKGGTGGTGASTGGGPGITGALSASSHTSGGQGANCAAGAAGGCSEYGGAAGGGSPTTGAGGVGGSSMWGGAAGGAGGTWNASALGAPGAGGGLHQFNTTGGGGTAGTSGASPTAGGNGAAGAENWGGEGGGGGGATSTNSVTGGKGGKGGQRGGGGGGGGPGVGTGSAGGAGGDGGDGYAIVVTYF